jgi:hypothetical protein
VNRSYYSLYWYFYESDLLTSVIDRQPDHWNNSCSFSFVYCESENANVKHVTVLFYNILSMVFRALFDTHCVQANAFNRLLTRKILSFKTIEYTISNVSVYISSISIRSSFIVKSKWMNYCQVQELCHNWHSVTCLRTKENTSNILARNADALHFILSEF